jgi:drug/metabolite transporter, DME family
MPATWKSKASSGWPWIVGAAICWSLLGPVSRVALETGVRPIEVAFWRALLGSIVFGVHSAVIRASLPARKDMPSIVLFALIGGSVFFAAYQFAVDSGGAALASVLLYTAPAWVIVAAAIMFSERITLSKILALMLTLAGVTMIALQGGGSHVSIAAAGWGLLAGISYASHYIFGKRLFASYRPELIYALIFPIAAITLWPLATFASKSTEAWLAILTVTLVSTYASYLLYGIGLKRMEAGRASLIATLEPVSATLIAYAWWGERFTPAGYIGAVLVLCGVVMALRRPGRRPLPAPAQGAE